MENQQSQYSLPPSSSFHRHHHLQPQREQQIMEMFWSRRLQEIKDAADIKNHPLPLARIKKVMKSDGEVHMVSADAPVLLAKACELFILELTARGWHHAEAIKSRLLQKSDITAGVAVSDVFDFLIDILPGEAARAKGAPAAAASTTAVAAPVTGTGSIGGVAPRMPYFFCPIVQVRPGVMMRPPEMGSICPPPMYSQPLPEFALSQMRNYVRPPLEYNGSTIDTHSTSDAAATTNASASKKE